MYNHMDRRRVFYTQVYIFSAAISAVALALASMTWCLDCLVVGLKAVLRRYIVNMGWYGVNGKKTPKWRDVGVFSTLVPLSQ